MSEIVARARSSTGHVEPAVMVDEMTLPLDAPLPLVEELFHRPVDGKHVWIGVQVAALIVLDEADHQLLVRLAGGEPPSRLSRDEASWLELSELIGRLAAAGLIVGIQGYREHLPPSAVKFARLHLTRACQLECEHCYADSSPRVDRSRELTTSRWQTFIADFARLGGKQVLFTGGEALLHDGCVDLMRSSRALGLHVTLFSNGLLVPRFLEEVHENVDKIQISLDGPDSATNDAVRGTNTFRHILRALDMLAARGTPTRIGMTAIPSQWNAWRQGFENIRERYARYPNIEYKLSYGVMGYGRGDTIDNHEVVDRRSVNEFLAQVNGHPTAKITRYQAGCGYAEQIVVGPDGTVFPCHLLDAAVCHLDDHPLSDIVKLLAGVAAETDVDHVDGCRECEIRYLCGGGCRVLAGRATGSRLQSTCTPAQKDQKYRNLAASYGAGGH